MNLKKKNEVVNAEPVMMTEEQFKEIQVLKTRKIVYTIFCVAGVGAMFALILCGLLEPLFEMTLFGRVFTPGKYKAFWGTDAFGTDGLISAGVNTYGEAVGSIYEDWLKMGTFLPKIGFTIVFLGIILAFVYIFTYVGVDIWNFFKSIFKGTKNTATVLKKNIKITTAADKEENDAIEGKKKEKKVITPAKVEEIEEQPVEKPKKESTVKKSPAKKKEKKVEVVDDGLENVATSDLDKLLSGNFDIEPDTIDLSSVDVERRAE